MTGSVLAQSDTANWVGAAGQWAGAIGTVAAVIVALWLARRDGRQRAAEQRDREAGQARLVTLAVNYPEYGEIGPWLGGTIAITNHSEQPIYRPRITSMGAPRPPTRWGLQTDLDDYALTEVLPPRTTHHVPFEHVDTRGIGIDTTHRPQSITSWVEIDAVRITFTDVAGIRWTRTGHDEPVRFLGGLGEPG